MYILSKKLSLWYSKFMKFFKLKKVPFIIFLILIILPIMGLISVLRSGNFEASYIEILVLPIFFIFNITSPYIKLIFKSFGIDSSVAEIPTGIDYMSIFVSIILYIVIIFAVAKIINLFFQKKHEIS